MFYIFLLLSEINISEKYYLKGLEYFKNSEYEKAYEQYKNAVKLEPTSGTYRISLGITLGKLEKYEEAIPHLKKAVFLDSTLQDAYYLIEDFYSRIGKIDEAIDYFIKEKGKFPNRPTIYINLGHLYYRKKDFYKAEEEFRKAEEIEPENPIVQCGLGIIMLAQEKIDDAEKYFLNALKIDSLYPEAHLYYSIVLEKKNLKKEAEEQRRIAYNLKPELRNVDLSGALPLRGEKTDIPFILSTFDIIVERLIRPEYRLLEVKEKPFNLNLGTGITTINNTKWLSITTRPGMETAWLGFSLAFDFLVNFDSVRTKELDYRKIFQNIRIGHPNLPVYAGVGAINNYTLGLGLIVRNYFNQADENNRKMGSVFTLQTPDNSIGITGMVNNLKPIEISVGRAYIGKWASYADELLQRFEIGITFAQDNEYDYRVIGGDILFYLTSSGLFHFLLASEFAKTLGHGWGDISGIFLSFGGLGRNSLSFSLFGAGMILGKDFEPAPFDAFYEKDRKLYGPNILNLLNRYNKDTYGYYGLASLNLGIFLKASFDYQSITGIDSSGIFTARISVAENMPIILKGAFYKCNFDDFNTLTKMDENTYILGIAGIKFMEGLFSLNLNYERTYVYDETSNSYKIQERTTPQLQFNKRF